MTAHLSSEDSSGEAFLTALTQQHLSHATALGAPEHLQAQPKLTAAPGYGANDWLRAWRHTRGSV
ncbi:MAG: hypothetical protein OXU20_37640 [Myxococcales bacterium]|nr:hypothetical protein [Myxococcales bacterium]